MQYCRFLFVYFNNLCHPIQPVKQGPYNPEFMGVLLHYMRTQIDVSDFNPERLIRAINNRVNTSYNEQLERQYADIDCVERYVINNVQDFIEGIDTSYIEDYMKIPNYTVQGIQKKLNKIWDVTRINKKIYGTNRYVKIRKYTLKPREQIKDLYSIIDYINYAEHIEETDEIDKLNEIL